MATSIAELMSGLVTDPWRAKVGFSPQVEAANRHLFDTESSDVSIQGAVTEWLARHQPCLFGRIAAKTGHLSYCILRESDLLRPDEHIQARIQQARTAWTRDGYSGKKSGFIVLTISQRIAEAIPNDTVKQIALRLCSMYLLREIVPDQVFHDEIFLEMEGPSTATWQWLAGVNYFCAQGDKRWWQDHRIPGGMAFSVNSVGHMVKSTILSEGMNTLNRDLGLTEGEWDPTRVNSLGTALGLAMKTINMASDTSSGRATRLLPIPEDDDGKPLARCPFRLFPDVVDRNFREYMGWYHTDVTVPSEYFVANVERPANLGEHILDFSYLFDRSIENPDHITMGEGRRIRDDEPGHGESGVPSAKLQKMEPEIVPMADCERLRRALES